MRHPFTTSVEIEALPQRKAPYTKKISEGYYLLIAKGKLKTTWKIRATALGVDHIIGHWPAMSYGNAVSAVEAMAKVVDETGAMPTSMAETEDATFGDVWQQYLTVSEAKGKTAKAMKTIHSHGLQLEATGLFEKKVATTTGPQLNKWKTSALAAYD
jgi:hypothetical protein